MSWMKQINELLKDYQGSRYGTKVRLLATMFPEPTISINVFYRGRKTLEMPIEDLPGFIEDLQTVMNIIDEAIESGEIDLDEIEERRREYEESRDEEEDEDRSRSRRSRKSSNSKSRSSKSSSRKSRKRTVKRD